MTGATQRKHTREAVRAVAAFEAFKGLMALIGASGLLLLIHEHDLHEVALRLVKHLHLNPASHYPNVFITATEHLENMRLSLIALGAIAYSTIRLVEAYGLFFEAAWAEVLAAVSGAIYVPFEVIESLRRPSWMSIGALVINIAIVAIMIVAMLQRRKERKNIID